MSTVTFETFEKRLKFTLGALEKFEELSGVSAFDSAALQKPSAKVLRILFFCGLLDEIPDLTMERVISEMTRIPVHEIVKAIGEAYSLAMQGATDEKKSE